MTILVVIGNGFDIQNGLPTSYREFHERYNFELSSSLKYFPDFYEDQEWSCFEENLANFDSDSFREHSAWEPSIDEMAESSKYAHGFNDEIIQKTEDLTNMIRASFNAWINSIDVNKASRFMIFPEGCKFINFNYTRTLQKVYLIPDENILHIHGCVGGHMVFGHDAGGGDQEDSLLFDDNEPWFEEANHALASVTDKFHKPVRHILENNRSVLDSYVSVSKIIIIGHSINDIDTPYFELLIDSYPKAIWENWNFGEGVSGTHRKLINLGIDRGNIISKCSSGLGLSYPCS